MQSFDAYNVTLITTAFITGVISPILINVTRYILRKKIKQHDCEIIKNLNIEDHITTKLEKIREYTNSDRVWISEFHNGGHMFTGRSMQKFSETYEVVSNGISREGVNTQNLPTSLFSSFFKTVSEKGIFYVNNLSEAGTMKGFFEARGVKCFLSIVIRNIESQTIGVICLEKVQSNDFFTEDVIKSVQSDVNVISGYLENFLVKQ